MVLKIDFLKNMLCHLIHNNNVHKMAEGYCRSTKRALVIVKIYDYPTITTQNTEKLQATES
jgi:hypothetical protein